MKIRPLLFSTALIAGTAFAGDIITGTFNQTGNGANGMTAAAPSAATDGVAASLTSGLFGHPTATTAVVTIQSDEGDTFASHATQGYMRGWRYTLAPDGGGNSTWIPVAGLDLVIDAGSLANKNKGAIQFGPVQLPPGPSGTRFAWTGEQVHSTSTLDGGINVTVELFTSYPN